MSAYHWTSSVSIRHALWTLTDRRGATFIMLMHDVNQKRYLPEKLGQLQFQWQ